MLDFAFFLGVVFITFNLVWGFLTFFLRAFIGEIGNKEKYILRLTQAYFMASMTALATLQYSEKSDVHGNVLLATGITVLFLYLISKIEQRKKMIQFSFQLNRQNVTLSKQHLKYDVIIAVCTVVFYAVSVFYTQLIENAANQWFFTSIQNIYKTPVIGWIIGLVGVFFIFGVFIKGVASFQIIYDQIVSFIKGDNGNEDDNNNNNEFTDYEFVEEEQNLID